MHVLLRAVITGFGFSLGAAIYKKVAKELGFEDSSQPAPVTAQTGETAESTS